jgi:hypothetical protein
MISLPPRSKVYIFHDSVSFHKQAYILTPKKSCITGPYGGTFIFNGYAVELDKKSTAYLEKMWNTVKDILTY